MKVRKYQASEEKTILVALIVHDQVLRTVVQDIGPDPRGLFKSKWSNLIARWCFEYFAKHRKAPAGIIQDLFVKYAQTEPEDEASVSLVESFLETLSGEYAKLAEELNPQWVLEKAADYFEKVRLERMAEGVQVALERQDIVKAREFYSLCKPVAFSQDAWLNPFSRSTIATTLERLENVKPLVVFPGPMGTFLSQHFERDGFISFAGPEKRGKSFWLQEVVWKALNQRRRVLYYVLGDMSADQVYRRLYSRMTGKPKWRNPKEPVLKIPTTIRVTGKDDDGKAKAECSYEEKDLRGYNNRDVDIAVGKLRLQAALKDNPLRLKCQGADTITASGIEQDIQNLTEEGFIPDVVVIDYADLLLSEKHTGKMDFRHQIDATWKVLRRISTQYHLLVVTATQAAARSYTQFLIRKGDFSEDKRKNAHVTGMIGINQNPVEKKKGIYRLNWIFLRDGIWTETQYVWTAGNLALGCPCFTSLL